MCDPGSLFLTQALITAGTGVYTTAQQSANAKAAQKYQERVYETNRDLADRAALRNYGDLARRQIEERESAAAAIFDVARTAKQSLGTARASAAEAGTGGANIDALLLDFERQELDYETRVIRSQGFRDTQYEGERYAIREQQQGRILSALPQPVEKPDFFGAALRIGTNILGDYQSQTTFDRATGKRVWKADGSPAFGG